MLARQRLRVVGILVRRFDQRPQSDPQRADIRSRRRLRKVACGLPRMKSTSSRSIDIRLVSLIRWNVLHSPGRREHDEAEKAGGDTCLRGRGRLRPHRPGRHGRGEEVGRKGVSALHVDQRAAAEGDGVVRQCRQTLQGHGDQRPVGDDPHARVRSEDADQGVRGDHRHQGESPGAGRGRGRAGRADADADQPESVRRLYQRLGSDRHALAPAVGGQSDRLDGGRRQGRHAADARRQRLHRPVVHHRARRQALAAARPAVRQPVLVPLRLVQARGLEEAVQGPLRLRARRAAQLVGLRGHRGVLLACT